MYLLANLFVGKPLNIAMVALVFLAGYFVMRAGFTGASRNPRALWMPVAAWLLYAIWKWLVVWRTPEANIRVDLLLIWPVLVLLSIVAIYRAFRHPRGAS